MFRYVYGVYRNVDMTEGRGPMVLDTLFYYENEAWDYAEKQLGVMGYRPKEGWLWYQQNIANQYGKLGDLYSAWGGDWEVRKLPVHAIAEEIS